MHIAACRANETNRHIQQLTLKFNATKVRPLMGWSFSLTIHRDIPYNMHMFVCLYSILLWLYHDDVIEWTHFSRYWPFVRGIHRSPVNSPLKGQWRGALMFSLICAWINGWVNNSGAGDLRRHRAHYDVTVIFSEPFRWFMRYRSIVPYPSGLLHWYRRTNGKIAPFRG